MVGSLLPSRHAPVAKATTRREASEDAFPIMYQWYGFQTVGKTQMLNKVVFTFGYTVLSLASRIIVLLEVIG